MNWRGETAGHVYRTLADARRRRTRIWILAFLVGPLVALLVGMLLPLGSH